MLPNPVEFFRNRSWTRRGCDRSPFVGRLLLINGALWMELVRGGGAPRNRAVMWIRDGGVT